MATNCDSIAKCPFFNKDWGAKEPVYKVLKNNYCQGDKWGDCQRKAYKKLNGTSAADNMIPNGTMA